MAKLVVRDLQHTYLVDIGAGETLVLGRSHDCDLPVTAGRASRRHAEIRAVDGGHEVVDLGSTNGTLLNGAPFPHPTRLRDGDTVDVGGATVLYLARA